MGKDTSGIASGRVTAESADELKNLRGNSAKIGVKELLHLRQLLLDDRI